jgi:hypothetical protein
VPVDYYLGFDSLSASATYIPIYIMEVHTNAYMNMSNNKIIKKYSTFKFLCIYPLCCSIYK